MGRPQPQNHRRPGSLARRRPAERRPPRPQTPELSPGTPLAVWYDASGKGRNLVQKDAAARPLFQSKDGYAAVRFDGERQHLTLPGIGRSFKEATVFLVAAPFGNPGDFRGFLALNQAGKNDYSSGLTIDQGPGSRSASSRSTSRGPVSRAPSIC